jgi:uncharacterized protein YidB (DUF937 family)
MYPLQQEKIIAFHSCTMYILSFTLQQDDNMHHSAIHYIREDTMGIFDKIVSAAQTLGKERGHNQNVVENVVGLFKESGVNGLVEKFREGGLEDTVKSWIGTGENRPITQEQVRNTLGADKVRDFAEKSGMSEEQATRELQDILPHVIDKATPDGTYDPEDGGKE